MERTQNLHEELLTLFALEEKDIRSIAPLKLAYLGDAVFEIILRTLVLESTDGPVKKLHAQTSAMVNAGFQAKMILALLDDLTDEEMSVYRRGRNAKTSSVAKHADIHDYRNATGLEALWGYLYLNGQMHRALELCRIGFDKLEIKL